MRSVRRYCPREDELPVRKFFFANAANSLNRFYLRIISQEGSFQVFLLASAISFVSFDIPLHYCFAIPLLGALILYLLLWCGSYQSAWAKVRHLKRYSAAAVSSPGSAHLSLIEAADGSILGTLGVEGKVDPDMSEPPGSVGWINAFTLLPQPFSAREPAALELMGAVLERHCVKEKNFGAVEMLVSEDQDDEKIILEKQGFHINKVIQKKYFGVFNVSMYRYRLELSPNASLSSSA